MGESRRAEECTGISLPITHLNKPTSQHWPAYSLPLLCDGRGGGREEQGHPEEDNDHRQPCKPGFPAQTERAALVEDPGGRRAGRGGEPARDPCAQAAPGSLLPLLQLQVCPAHASENIAAILSSKRIYVYPQSAYVTAKNYVFDLCDKKCLQVQLSLGREGRLSGQRGKGASPGFLTEYISTTTTVEVYFSTGIVFCSPGQKHKTDKQ